MFVVVLFNDTQDVAAVPKLWLEGNTCFWPPYQSDAKIRKATSKCEAPNKLNWPKYNIRILGRGDGYETFLEAQGKAKLAEETSDLSELESRRRKRNCLYDPYSSSDDDSRNRRPLKKSVAANPILIPAAPSVSQQVIELDPAFCFHERELVGLQQCGDETSGSELPNTRDLESTSTRQSSSVQQTRLSPVSTTQSGNQPNLTPRQRFSMNPRRLTHSEDPSTSAASNFSDISDKNFKRMVLTNLAVLTKTVNNLVLLLSKNTLTTAENLPPLSEMRTTIPAATIQNLDTLEMELENDEEQKNVFVGILAACGGKDISSAISKMGQKFVNDDLAATFNFNGLKGKAKFRRYRNICVGIFNALRLCFSNEPLTETKFGELMGHWLTNVGERVRKRHEKADKQAN